MMYKKSRLIELSLLKRRKMLKTLCNPKKGGIMGKKKQNQQNDLKKYAIPADYAKAVKEWRYKNNEILNDVYLDKDGVVVSDSKRLIKINLEVKPEDVGTYELVATEKQKERDRQNVVLYLNPSKRSYVDYKRLMDEKYTSTNTKLRLINEAFLAEDCYALFQKTSVAINPFNLRELIGQHLTFDVFYNDTKVMLKNENATILLLRVKVE